MFKDAVITAQGLELDAKILAGHASAIFTGIKIGDGVYSGTEDLTKVTDLRSIKQEFAISSISIIDNNTVRLRSVVTNTGIVEGYYMSELGVYAQDPDKGKILYSIALGVKDRMDYQPSEVELLGATSTIDTFTIISNSKAATIKMGLGAAASAEDLEEKVDIDGGDISETVIETLESIDTKYPVPSAGESTKVFVGKVKKYIEDTKPLDANTTIYVATTGSDVTGDGTSAKPFKTIQYAIDTLPKDLGGYECIVQIADGTYPEDVRILGFHSGSIRIYSSNILSISTVCSVNSFFVSQCSAYIFVSGINITSTTKNGIEAYNVHEMIVRYCSTTGENKTNGVGYRFAECNFQIFYCIASNKNVALETYKSNGHSSNWGTTSGNNIGIRSTVGSIVTIAGTQPQGTYPVRQADGSMFVNENGTQISGLIASGLSCAWGTIRRGGYVRLGNQVGAALINVDINMSTNAILTAGQQYQITGFPIPAQTAGVAAYCHADHFHQIEISPGGVMYMEPKNNLGTGLTFTIGATYLTNS